VIALYGTTPADTLLSMAYAVDETPDTLLQWIEANLTGIDDAAPRESAYTSLSRADEYLGFTYRQQYHVLWRYATALMVLGVARVTARRGLHSRITAPERWRRMSAYQKQKAVRASMVRKVASSLHMPQRTLKETYMSPLAMVIDKDPLTYARDFSLDSDELDLFIHDRSRSASVAKILASEEKERETRREKETKVKTKRKADGHTGQQEIPLEKRDPPPPDPRQEKASPANQKTLFEGF